MKAPAFWQRRGPGACALLPLAALFAAVAAVRRLAYRRGWLAVERVPVPVIVVGNISVGGTGKTPLLVALAECLRGAGHRPGIVARGYGGRSRDWPRAVDAQADPAEVGDEPVLLAGRRICPVFVGPDRVAAARALLAAHPDCDLLLADDGLQHYRLGRDVEVVVVDGRRRFGNGWPLPAGPLREPSSRLAAADFVVVNGAAPGAGEWRMDLVGDTAHALDDPARTRPLAAFRGRPLHALAGIGDPGRFFAALAAAGLDCVPHAFPDHHAYAAADLAWARGGTLLMTEKDAVKCRRLGLRDDAWYLPVSARLDPRLLERLLARVATLTPGGDDDGQETARHPGVPGQQGAARV